MNSDFAIEAENLTRRFDSFVAVDGISFSVRRGEIFGFLGPNGAGKSTTIRMLCGILKSSGGRASVAGFDIDTQSDAIKQRIGYMSQRFSLYNDLTVEENIEFYGGVYGVDSKKLAEKKQWIIEMGKLEGLGNRLTGTLPTGWKQRLALGCALVHDPEVIFLDEPTSGTDPASRRETWDFIHDLAEQGVTIFLTTHYMDEAEHCYRVSLIYGGKLIATGSPDELKSGMAHHSFELDSDSPLMAADAAADLPWVEEAMPIPTGVSLISHEPMTEAELEQRLRAEGVPITKARFAIPSLEAVYVSLLEGEKGEKR